MFELFTAENLMSLLVLTFMEIVLGVDNIIFMSIVSDKLPVSLRARARNFGLGIAAGLRLLLLLGISFVMALKTPLLEHGIEFFGHTVNPTGQSLILLIGGIFLLYKSVKEIHEKLEGGENRGDKGAIIGFGAVVAQIALINLIFSVDSILTAIGLTSNIYIMAIGVILAVLAMSLFAGPVSNFVNKHPTVQMLGLSFLILIGFMLILESAEQAGAIPHGGVPKGYLYFAIFFSVAVEMLNLKMTTNKAVKLKNSDELEKISEEQS